MIGFVAIALHGASVPGPSAPQAVTTVRADARSGRLVRRVIAPRPPSRSPERLRSLAEDTAKRHDVEPSLVESVIHVESRYNTHAVSPKGAQGLMQLIPATARRFGVANPFDPAQNLEGGVRYLKYLLDLYGGDEKLALAAYNAGEGAVARYRGVPPYPETRDYVRKVGQRLESARSRAVPVPPPAKPTIEVVVDAEGREHYRSVR